MRPFRVQHADATGNRVASVSRKLIFHTSQRLCGASVPHQKGPHWGSRSKHGADVLMKQGHPKDALSKYGEALEYTPHPVRQGRPAVHTGQLTPAHSQTRSYGITPEQSQTRRQDSGSSQADSRHCCSYATVVERAGFATPAAFSTKALASEAAPADSSSVFGLALMNICFRLAVVYFQKLMFHCR